MVANGYKHPDQLIDHDANLTKPEAFFGIFAAYNQHNIANKTKWDTWPSWELCLTEMDIGLHFFMPEIDTHKDWVQREHWLALAQTIHKNPSISMEGYTITIEGQNGHTFAFDFCLEIERGCAWDVRQSQSRNERRCIKPNGVEVGGACLVLLRVRSAHSLGPYWTCPDYIPEYGGESTIHTPDDYFCIDRLRGPFPQTCCP